MILVMLLSLQVNFKNIVLSVVASDVKSVVASEWWTE